MTMKTGKMNAATMAGNIISGKLTLTVAIHRTYLAGERW
jgi:hypothetical protein